MKGTDLLSMASTRQDLLDCSHQSVPTYESNKSNMNCGKTRGPGNRSILATSWTLEKNGREAIRVLVGHPLGSEARVLVDDDLIRSEHFKDGKERLGATAEWQERLQAHGLVER